MTRREQIEAWSLEIMKRSGGELSQIDLQDMALWADANPENEIKIIEEFNKITNKKRTTFEFNYEGDLKEFTEEMKLRESKLTVAEARIKMLEVALEDISKEESRIPKWSSGFKFQQMAIKALIGEK